MKHLDWRVLSGPRVSRRTLMQVAMATGAFGFAQWLSACAGGEATPTAAPAAGTTPQAAPATPSGATPAAAATPAGEARRGGMLRLGFGIGQILTLDPAQVTQGIVAGELVSNIFSSLVQFDKELGLVPDLAETWEVNEDGTEYTFHLRDGLKFHNGDPLLAQDFIYTYERTTNPDFASPHANKLNLISSITAPDELTLVIKLSEPYAPFLATACSRGPGRALTPISKRAIEEMGDQQFGLTPVGCGPFMVVPESVEVGKGFRMVAFEDWYGGRPLLDEIVVQIIPEPSSRISALEAGDVDMLDIVPASGVEQLKANDRITLVEAPGTNWIGLTMNYARPPWDNLDARMAVSKAINRQEFIDKALFGLAVPSIGAIAPAFGWVYVPPEQWGENPQGYNLEEAKALAEKAGLRGTSVKILSSAQDPRPEEVLRTMLQEIGLDVQIEQLQDAAYNERWEAGDYDMNINGSVVDADPDDGHWNFFHSQGPWNTYGYNNPRVDELLEGTRRTNNQDERREMWHEIQRILQQDVAYAFLYHTPDRTAFYNYVKGYVAIPEMRYLETVWLEK